MAVWGLDVQQVRQLSTQLNTKAGDIESVLTTLTTALNSTEWTGPDATAFRGDWSGQHTAALKNVIQALRDTATKASKNAQDQETASA
ncbi:hypothetical protein GY21_04280 [Cryobacterium roopkundense]|uniref:Uncharacterized protein YukE n=1 Tax=Cryobacterium roopkundense TaxID=1001240 RepID=A0A099JNC9_9MICO|nr:WXG100 family type VII secretion target [Cryobacterium roopkundense]KGJ79651.1 hypothetical protein GY21_04280 [Cryobacterium roopkundense]MBB5642491.1 uncharacterized protein YukE [Cryobacterium roopkundense]